MPTSDVTVTITVENHFKRQAERAMLQAAVMRQIFCPYSEVVLDVRKAVLVDGTDHGKRMHIMTADVYDAIVANGIWDTWNVDDYDILDGRELFK